MLFDSYGIVHLPGSHIFGKKGKTLLIIAYVFSKLLDLTLTKTKQNVTYFVFCRYLSQPRMMLPYCCVSSR